MQYETHRRSILKAISWRTLATITTAIIVFFFTGELALALTVGLIEVFAKMGLYIFHERAWQKIRYGKREIPSFTLWFTGLPASGKKSIADLVYKELTDHHLRVERIDGLDVRPLFPEIGFSPEEVNRHIRRAGHLCSMLEKNGVIVVASFVSPFRESRDLIRDMSKHFVEVYLKTTPEACEARDEKDRYQKARSGEYEYFPGVHVAYEESVNPEVVIDVDHVTVEEAARQIVLYVKKNIIGGKI
jgi:adenylylsulfate kinase